MFFVRVANTMVRLPSNYHVKESSLCNAVLYRHACSTGIQNKKQVIGS